MVNSIFEIRRNLGKENRLPLTHALAHIDNLGRVCGVGVTRQ
jgi:hypothetical protein